MDRISACKKCGAAFSQAAAGRSECCSVPCTRAWAALVAKDAAGLVEAGCAKCGDTFKRYPSLIGLYCSRACAGEARSAAALAERTDPMVCTGCGDEKPLAEFGRDRKCKRCIGGQHRGERGRRRNLMRKYGMTLEQWQDLFEEQGSCCAICFEPLRASDAHTDHDHVTSDVRGILCPGCNNGLGAFRDSPTSLRRAAEYVS